MRIIFVILLCLVLGCKGPTTAANTEQSCLSSLQDDLLQSCKANEQFCTENNKLLRNHIELLTNSMEEMTINSCGQLHDQVQKLLKKENELGKEIERKNERIRELEENLKKEQMENINYKSKEEAILDDLQQKVEKLKVSFKAKETELQRELQSKNEQITQLGKNVTELQLENGEWRTKLQSELTEKKNPASCIERDTSGVQRVTLCSHYTFEVLCNADIAGPGWTVIQQRIEGGVNFKRSWKRYRKGFGNFWDGDFFLGLEKIHRLTTEQPHELYIHMTRFNGSTYFARYDEFAISGEEDNYKMTKLGKFNGSTTDELKYHYNEEFSTYDHDHDSLFFENCAEKHEAGWWYDACATSNLNGIYYDEEVNEKNGIYWEDYTSLKQVRMMIRPLRD